MKQKKNIASQEFVTYTELSEYLRTDYVTLQRWVHQRDYGFPKPFKLTQKKIMFRMAEILEWVESKRVK